MAGMGQSGGGVNTGMTGGGYQLYNALGYDPSQPQGGGFNWRNAIGLVGGGLEDIGKGMGSSGSSTPSFGSTPSMSQGDIATGAPYQTPTIPAPNIDDLIARLLGSSGGYG